MTEQEARARCARLSAESPERLTHSWLPRKSSSGEWKIVRLAVPSPAAPDSVITTASTEQSIKGDPRSVFEKNVPPNGAAFGF